MNEQEKSEQAKRWRDAAVAKGIEIAAAQFKGRRGHGGNRKLAHRQMGEAQLAALLALAFELGAEHARDIIWREGA